METKILSQVSLYCGNVFTPEIDIYTHSTYKSMILLFALCNDQVTLHYRHSPAWCCGLGVKKLHILHHVIWRGNVQVKLVSVHLGKHKLIFLIFLWGGPNFLHCRGKGKWTIKNKECSFLFSLFAGQSSPTQWVPYGLDFCQKLCWLAVTRIPTYLHGIRLGKGARHFVGYKLHWSKAWGMLGADVHTF